VSGLHTIFLGARDLYRSTALDAGELGLSVEPVPDDLARLAGCRGGGLD
jgi:hypothetical protein